MIVKEYIGDYAVGDSIGSGSFGEVYKVTEKDTKKIFAMKKIFKNKIIQNGMGGQVQKEIYILKKIHHPNIVRVYEVLMSKDALYIIMEHIVGGELYGLISKYGILLESKCRNYVRQILDALAFCHGTNICHRDIKPQNVLLDDKDNIKIIDFGFASIMEVEDFEDDISNVKNKNHNKNKFGRMEARSASMKKLGTICGTEDYMAPEILNEERYKGDKIDIWSTGVMIYFLLQCNLPFAARDKYRTEFTFDDSGDKRISSIGKDFIRCMLKSNPDERYSAAKLLEHPWLSDIDDNNKYKFNMEDISRENRQFSAQEDIEHAAPVRLEFNRSLSINPVMKRLEKSFSENQEWETTSDRDNNVLNVAKMSKDGLHLIAIDVYNTHIFIHNSDDDDDDDNFIPLEVMNEVVEIVKNSI